MRILQIGAGPTGASLFNQLYFQIEKSTPTLEYVIVDNKKPGNGTAFGTSYNSHLINLPASTMSINPNNLREFVEWRARNQFFWQDGSFDEAQAWSEFPPRRLFGTYVEQQFQNTLNNAPHAEFVKTSVVCVTPIASGGKFIVEFENRTKELFDNVVICIGHAPKAPFFPSAPSNFYHTPYQKLQIPINATVGIIGSRLTAIDAALALQEKGHTGKIFMISRSGKLPKVIAKHHGYDYGQFTDYLLKETNHTLDSLITIHKREIERVSGNTIDWAAITQIQATKSKDLENEIINCANGNHLWQSVLLASYNVIDKLWSNLNPSEKARFMSDFYGTWMTYLAAFPAFSARKILAMMKSAQLRILSELKGVETTEQGFSIYHGDNSCLNVDYLIDGRGVGYGEADLKKLPLLKNMFANGAIKPHAFGGLAINPSTFQAISNSGREVNGLYIVGDLTKGEFLATTDVVRNVAHCVAATSAILSHNQ